MSRSRKGSPRCPSFKCSWCGGKAAADHRDAMHMQTSDEIDEALLDSPDFKPDALAAFEARGFVRVNRRG